MDETLPLSLEYADALLLNARVRDNALDADYRAMPGWLHPDDIRDALSFNPSALALKILQAIARFEHQSPVYLQLTLPEAWYLERRFRHNDPEPAGRMLLRRVHAIILEFVSPSLPKWMEEALDDANRTDADEDAHPDAREDANPPTDTDA